MSRLSGNILLAAWLLAGCTNSSGAVCAPGTVPQGGACLAEAGGASDSAGSGSGSGSSGDSGSGGSGSGSSSGSSGSALDAGSGSGSAMDSGGSVDAPVACLMGTGPASLPFAVDDYFIASGWMGSFPPADGGGPPLIQQTSPCVQSGDGGSDGGSKDAGSSEAGFTDAGGAPGGKCWTVTYTPTHITDWAGVDWQYPALNWDAPPLQPGRIIPAGATKVTFYAWGESGTEIVDFNVGYGAASNDRFGASLKNQTLTKTRTLYSIDLTSALNGIDYTCSSVRMGFGWVTSGGTPATFHIDTIQWQ